ncbi:ICMT-domain-containing protein [Obba rivulosa]|uniref:Protein-S-isoprenylcysteine O-methyltransferase n=1 Tax=Obba rivulosa TaxID=1052685 RepID=A0A8E2AUP2_9APHY|nr:ICMT-domain-containing protein [Obba rivulosa]
MSNLVIQDVLLKLPLLVIAAYAGHTTLTSPNATPQDEEQKKYGSKQDTVTRMIWVLPAVKTTLWLSTLSEIATLISRRLPVVAMNLQPRLCNSERGAARVGITSTFLVGFLLIVSGAALRSWCFRELGRQFTFHLSVRDGHKLITSGPYALVRHPSYLGFLVYGVGSVMCLFGGGSWARECGVLGTAGGQLFLLAWSGLVLLVGLMFFGRAALEDEALRKEFKVEWVEYARHTPYRIIPYIY